LDSEDLDRICGLISPDAMVSRYGAGLQYHYSLKGPLNRLAATYAMLGGKEEARAYVKELLKVEPKYTIKRAAKRTVYKNQTDQDHWINALRKAGVPEE